MPDNPPKPCPACGADMEVGAWKCRACQHVTGWRSYLNLGLPIVSVGISLAAVLIASLPFLKEFIYEPHLAATAQRKAEGAFEVSFVNSGQVDALVPADLYCSDFGREADSYVFSSGIPTVVKAQSIETTIFTLLFADDGDVYDRLIIGDPETFLKGKQLYLHCRFPSDLGDDFYTFEGRRFELGINHVRGSRSTPDQTADGSPVAKFFFHVETDTPD